MKKTLIILIFFMITAQGFVMEIDKQTALVLIDIQDFYFTGGAWELVGAEKAGENAGKVLRQFRNAGNLIIHVKHNVKDNADIHNSVSPIDGEKIITKEFVNSFRDTDLLEYLKKNGIDKLVLCGMQTHLCLEAATRAAADLRFKCLVVHDACATKDVEFDGHVISASDVHHSTLSTLKGSYAEIIDTSSLLKKLSE